MSSSIAAWAAPALSHRGALRGASREHGNHQPSVSRSHRAPFQQIQRRKATVLPARKGTLGEAGAVALLVGSAVDRRSAARGIALRLRAGVDAPVALADQAPVGSAIGASNPGAASEGASAASTTISLMPWLTVAHGGNSAMKGAPKALHANSFCPSRPPHRFFQRRAGPGSTAQGARHLAWPGRALAAQIRRVFEAGAGAHPGRPRITAARSSRAPRRAPWKGARAGK